MGQTNNNQPMAGVRVLDIATFVAAPFCGTILADFGAEVIKIEQPAGGDTLRKFGTPTECGDSMVWLSEARNKQSVTLDLRSEQGAELFRQLVAKSDVVLENFRPGTLEKWGLSFESLLEINPKLVMLRVSAYGQTGPKRGEPGFARIAHAFGGLAFLAGENDGPPVVPGSTSLADYISGMWGAIGVLLALRSVEAGGTGQFVDIGLYESVFRLLDEIAPVYAKYGYVRERMGADTINVVPHSHYQTKDGEWIALACSNDRMFERLAQTMGTPELAIEYPTSPDRVKDRAKINALVALWVSGFTQKELLDICKEGQVPAGPINSIADIFEDPQFAARENLIKVQDPRIGELVLPNAMPRLSKTPAAFVSTGPALGSSTDDILSRLLGLSPEVLQALKASNVI
ncbi:CaiB/BaiF CoA transferase family protein [Pseudomonas marginalis]|uniref:Uncharacterized protein n=2 Tax=Pseudomonas marginalis TaxID=298 RepID=A0A3M3X6S4_PSEMA|nr:CoA transferase [Pseudomonas marginalis]RMO65639.1 hypothetical protein ALQ38_03740 [Pseudomonas marginalis pv. marginalis]RMO99995.1 hypothetical protein ALQ29_02963 [Pseudomonas marginalis pv. marginalis]